PYRVWHLNHLNVLSIHWGLFTLLFLQRALRRGRVSDIVLTACAATLTSHADFEIAATTALAATGLAMAALRRADRRPTGGRRAPAWRSSCTSTSSGC